MQATKVRIKSILTCLCIALGSGISGLPIQWRVLVLVEILETKQNLERLILSVYPVLEGNALATFGQHQFSIEKLTKLRTLKIQNPDKVLFTKEYN